MKGTVFLTGASGRIGGRVLELLLSAGYQVKALVHRSRPPVERSNQLELVQGDVLDQQQMNEAVQGCRYVLHLAAAWDMFPPAVHEKENDQLFESIIRGSYNLLEASRRSPGLDLFVYASTDATYATGGRAFDGPITEETELVPSRFYAIGKIVMETMCEHYGKLYGLPWSIVRICWTLEPAEFVRLFTYEFWEGAMEEEDRKRLGPLLAGGRGLFVPLNSDGSSGVDHASHPDDIAAGILSVVERHPTGRGRIYNLAGPRAFHYLDVVKRLAERIDLPWESARISSIRPYELSIERARKELGYNPLFGADEMLAEALPTESAAGRFRSIVLEALR
ncbi:NAD-dependent epimerase/dehydratase family protein [Salinispira pacifica]